MYKNYKIDSEGKPKYNGSHYRITPERRSTEVTDEWKKRLEGHGPKAHRRRVPQKKSATGLKVIHLVYLVGFILLISFINIASPNNTVSNRVSNPVNIILSNAVTDVGNEIIKPLQGNMFLHVDLNLENKSNNILDININNFIMAESGGKKYEAIYYNNQNQIMNIDMGAKSNIVSRLSFEIPIAYKGELLLSYIDQNSNVQNIRSFVIE